MSNTLAGPPDKDTIFMRIHVLGSSAGGGFPQWNCNCRNCAGVRSGAVRAQPRTQSSLFVQPDDALDGVLPYRDTDPEVAQILKALERTFPTMPPFGQRLTRISLPASSA